VPDRRLEVGAHARRHHGRGRVVGSEPLGDSGQPGEGGIRVGVQRGDGHDAADPQPTGPAGGVGERSDVVGQRPAAVRVAVEADLDQHIDPVPAGALGASRERADQLRAVDGLTGQIRQVAASSARTLSETEALARHATEAAGGQADLERAIRKLGDVAADLQRIAKHFVVET